jgi:C4-dicarboxylate-binding protein DctP
LASIKASGRIQLITLKPEEKLELKKSLMKVHREVEPRVGKDLIDAIYRETNFSPDKL